MISVLDNLLLTWQESLENYLFFSNDFKKRMNRWWLYIFASTGQLFIKMILKKFNINRTLKSKIFQPMEISVKILLPVYATYRYQTLKT